MILMETKPHGYKRMCGQNTKNLLEIRVVVVLLFYIIFINIIMIINNVICQFL